MSELDAILASNDSDISKTRNLYEIASRKTTFDPKDNLLPTTTLQYLRAFCDIHRPRLTRRWIGLALRTIIDTSPQVCEHLAKFPAELALLGTLVLRGEESEELRIIAGLVIREACAHYVPYQSFWPSEKVFNGAPNFPLEGDHDWLHAFQNFVDTCDELKLISNPTSDPAILYPIALSASDGFRWMNTEQMAPALLIQDDIITVMTLDDSLQSFDFIDILGRNIVATSSRKSALHDSQAREKIKNEPWDLIITLNPDPWTFHINLSEHFGTELIMMFKSKGDMTECQSCFNELVSPSRGPRMLSDQSQAQGKVFASPSLVCGANATPPRTETPCHVEPGNYSPSAHHTSMSQNYNASQISQAELPHSEKNGIKTEKQVAPGALPKIIKTSRRISSARREINGFDIPDDSPVIKRRSRLGAQNQADTRTSTSKANKSQPITCTKGTNSFEDDDDGDSLIPFAERTIIDPVMPMKSISKSTRGSRVTSRTKATNCKANTQQVAPAKYPVISKLVSKTQPVLGQEQKRNSSLEKVFPVKISKPVPNLPKEPQGALHVRHESNEAKTSGHAMSTAKASNGAVVGANETSKPMSGADSIEILSSNSKPLPGEPDEDSRAISGHADRNEIRHQKELGDFEVTRKDPFRQSSRNQVQAKFTRRLTETLVGDDLTLSPLGRVHLKSPSPTRTEIFAVKSKFQLVQVSKRISQAGHAEKVPYESTRPVPQQTVLVGEASQPSRQPEDKEHGDDLEGGTLVDHEDDLPIRPSPAPLSSSPPAPLGSADSSHSSTSAEPEEPRSPSVSYQDQDEMEWEATLEPHQRSVGEQLVRVSRRLMRHIVDAETAVDDMAKTYHEDGEHLIANLVNKNREHFDQTLRSIQEKKTSMRAEFEKIAKELSEEKKRFKDASSSRNGGEAQPIQLQNRPPPTSPLASRSDVER
ncbi:hypothetical protein B0J11DRAFT_427358 [Dendryphion nanum]|uniref:Uncharacterized protein n=1 Tax=Dendryphion nanum TaxID=256645 RepID=A0A9P9IT77_9PLEO|nr:hypothetical protein B0J11DRAFT_427358 [Dendryphion nanum]